MANPFDTMMEQVKQLAVKTLSSMDKPKVEVTGVGITAVTRDSISMTSTLTIENPFDFALPIEGINYKILSDNKEIASGGLASVGDVKKGKTSVDLPTSVPYDAMLNLMKDLGADGDIDYTMTVEVVFKLPLVGDFTFPVTQSGSLKLPTIADLLKLHS